MILHRGVLTPVTYCISQLFAKCGVNIATLSINVEYLNTENNRPAGMPLLVLLSTFPQNGDAD